MRVIAKLCILKHKYDKAETIPIEGVMIFSILLATYFPWMIYFNWIIVKLALTFQIKAVYKFLK